MAGITPVLSGQAERTTSFQYGGNAKIDFFKLMITKLRYQNVMGNQSEEDFLGQLAQFESLDQMTELTRTIKQMMDYQQLQQSSAILGREVTVGDEAGNPLVSGRVEKVIFRDGVPLLVIGGMEFNFDRVISVQ